MKTRLVRTGLVLACLLSMRASAEDEWLPIFHEGFENGGAMPSGWTQEYVDGSHNWVFVNGGASGFGSPASAYSGNYNAVFFDDYGDEYTTKLVSPAVEVSGEYSAARLTFWHYMEEWDLARDELRVYYKTSPGGSWSWLVTYTDNVSEWTRRVIDLPSAGQTYYIAFEGSTFWGYGVCVDDVRVEGLGSAAEGFEAWAQDNCPGMTVGDAFVADTDEDGVRNGFEYAFGTNLVSNAPLLNVLQVDGAAVVDVPRQLSETEPYVSVYLQMARSLENPGWSTNGIETVTHGQKPDNRSWFKPVQALTNGFFRLRGELLQ